MNRRLMRIHGLLFALALRILLCICVTGRAEIIPADRRTEWKPGVTYNGGIPNRTTVYKTLTPNPGGASDYPVIQDALDNCPDDQVVLLGPGIFHLSGETLWIRRSNITLRGSGPARTRILQTDPNQPPLLLGGTLEYDWVQQTRFTTDAIKGTHIATLESNPGLQKGELVNVNETYDPALTRYYHDEQTIRHDYLGWGEARNQNGVPDGLKLSRPIGQAMEIAAINGSEITFSTPFHMTFRVGRSAHLARIATAGSSAPVPPITRVGIEDMSLGYGGGGDGGGNVRLFSMTYSWLKNIESDHSSGAAVAFDGCFRCELRDSYLHQTVNPTPGGAGYGLEVDRYSADCLVENNISWSFNKVMVMRSSGGGNVIGYNYMQDGFGAYYPNLLENGLNASHMTTPHMELFEGNESFNFSGDATWGNSIYITAFRNHLTGQRTVAPPLDAHTFGFIDGNCVHGNLYFEDEGNRRAIGLSRGHYWYNFVGNVLGYDGMTLLSPSRSFNITQARFVYEQTDRDDEVPMWSLGEGDPNVTATALRHGNYDFASHDTHWDPGIADQALPDSLYLTTKPGFFGATPWPIVKPEDKANPIAGELPAKTRFKALVYPNALVPAIITPPANQIVNIGDDAAFTVTATYPEPLTYQWFYRGVDIQGATQPTLTLPKVQLEQAGTYTVVVTTPGFGKSYAAAQLSFTRTTITTLAEVTIEATPGGEYRLEFASQIYTPIQWYTLRPSVTVGTDTEAIKDCDGLYHVYRAVPLSAGANPEPVLRVKRYTRVSVDGLRGRRYRVEYADSLASPIVWQALTTLPLQSAAEFTLDPDSPNLSGRFYRVVLVD